MKLRQTKDVVIAGYTRGQGRRAGGFGALVVGIHDAGVLRWAGNVGTGFSESEMERLLGLLRPLRRPDSPFAVTPRMPRVRASDVTWVEPRLVAEVEFAEWTHEGRLRAPSYLRLREDLEAPEVRRERYCSAQALGQHAAASCQGRSLAQRGTAATQASMSRPVFS